MPFVFRLALRGLDEEALLRKATTGVRAHCAVKEWRLLCLIITHCTESLQLLLLLLLLLLKQLLLLQVELQLLLMLLEAGLGACGWRLLLLLGLHSLGWWRWLALLGWRRARVALAVISF